MTLRTCYVWIPGEKMGEADFIATVPVPVSNRRSEKKNKRQDVFSNVSSERIVLLLLSSSL